ncbi:chondroitinase-B domain-containing protein [Vibrio rarus]|uniref:chondroitinase-B domain-containing protein n=1 Tax=Vibrio rarus TaxID=413403 RepID=UPI0021C48EF6|nr:chondroitinase-B domain-containing protein [Vibrio rarus]
MKLLIVILIAVTQVAYILPALSKEVSVNTPQPLNNTHSSGWWDCSKTPIKTVHANRSDEIVTAIEQAKPGTQIIVDDGHYTFNKKLDIRVKGNQCKPIVIKAKNSGKAIIEKGDILFNKTSWITFEGFSINTITNKNNHPIFIKDSEYIRISRLNLDIKSNEKSKWINIKASTHIRIDHSEFKGTIGPGNYIFVGNPSRLINIDHNYFHDRANIGGNGGESIYLHGKHGHRWDMDAIVEYNLFKNLDSEWELIGIKSHQNTIRYNTFINNQGTVSIRGGDYNKVYGNYFLNYTSKSTGAVRVHGYYNKVFNNYAYGLTKSFVETYWGDRDVPYINREQRLKWWENHNDSNAYTIQETAYRLSTKNMIASNTIIDSKSLFFWSKKCLNKYQKISDIKRQYVDKNKEYVVYPPEHWIVANNLVINAKQLVTEKYLKRGDMPCTKPEPIHEKSFNWIGNIIHNDNMPVDFGANRTFAPLQWRELNPKEQPTETQGVYSINQPMPSTNFILLLGPDETDMTISKQLTASNHVGATMIAPPLTALHVGPLSK